MKIIQHLILILNPLNPQGATIVKHPREGEKEKKLSENFQDIEKKISSNLYDDHEEFIFRHKRQIKS